MYEEQLCQDKEEEILAIAGREEKLLAQSKAFVLEDDGQDNEL